MYSSSAPAGHRATPGQRRVSRRASSRPRGRELALRLTLRWPGVALWPAGALEEYIRTL